jgi:hypothetical protein
MGQLQPPRETERTCCPRAQRAPKRFPGMINLIFVDSCGLLRPALWSRKTRAPAAGDRTSEYMYNFHSVSRHLRVLNIDPLALGRLGDAADASMPCPRLLGSWGQGDDTSQTRVPRNCCSRFAIWSAELSLAAGPYLGQVQLSAARL